MTVSVVIRSKDEADRLRLVLASLARQSVPAQVVVVDDGSSDHTPEIVAEARSALDIVVVRHARPAGRAAASNAGAAAAHGDILVFLDGDTIAAPDFIADHQAVHRAVHRDGPDRVARGETWHLRCTRTLADPETGETWPHLPPLANAERDRLRVTRVQVQDDFAAIVARASPGVYPGAAPRRLYELEMRALSERPDSPWLWAAASGSNLSVRAEAFRAAGGFDPALDINEHRELALRLTRAGARMAAVAGARTYHLTHRSGWRDPLLERDWERVFFAAHPIAAVALLPLLWESLADRPTLPHAARLHSLPELAAAAARCQGAGSTEAFRALHCRMALQAAG